MKPSDRKLGMHRDITRRDFIHDLGLASIALGMPGATALARSMDADPGAVGWALDRQPLQWVVPYHEGAVRYFRELGIWSEERQGHNQRLLERQQLLAAVWNEVRSADHESDEALSEAWLQARVAALEAAGFDPVWR